MGTDLTTPAVSPEDAAEQVTIAAVMAAIGCGFNPTGKKNVNLKQAVDACAIIVTFLKEIEMGPPRSVTEWRQAVENLNITIGSK